MKWWVTYFYSRCEEGYYGDPIARHPCEPCLCPDIQGSGRFFATSCHHEPQSLSLTCVCREGHDGRSHVPCLSPSACRTDRLLLSPGTGNQVMWVKNCDKWVYPIVTLAGPKCDRCSPGYYGNLALPGASCELCLCNNNIDPNDHNACDRVTGKCLRCLHNTMGPRCEDCKPGYYGNALDQDCKGKNPFTLMMLCLTAFCTCQRVRPDANVVWQSAHVIGGGPRWLTVLWGVPVSVTRRQDNVPAGGAWWASSAMSARTDTGTWTERRDVNPAAVILLTLCPTSVTRQESTWDQINLYYQIISVAGTQESHVQVRAYMNTCCGMV